MLEDSVIERIQTLTLDDALTEVKELLSDLPKPQIREWGEFYRELKTQRRSYRLIAMPESYGTREQASRTTQENQNRSRARLKLLSFYALQANDDLTDK